MDGYQFIASLVGSLAWPSVVGILLFLLRRQITGLAIRLKELSLPGGMKATFEKELEVGRSIAEQIPQQAHAQIAPPAPEEEKKLTRLAIEAPEGAIVLAYIELEKALRDISVKLGMGSKTTNQRSIIEELMKRGLIRREAARLFDAVRAARNSAVHGIREQQVTSSEAAEYIRQVELLLALLRTVEPQL